MPEYYDILYNFKDLEDWVIKPKGKVTSLQYKFLKYFIGHRYSSAYTISQDRSFRGKTRYYDSTNEVVSKLLDLNLIEHTHRPSNHNARICQLSSRGICFLITNRMLSYEQLRDLIEKYGESMIFQLFLYPYVSKESLLKIRDSFIFSRIQSYLSECFEKLEDTVHLIRHTFNQKNGNLTQHLFMWDEIPDKRDKTERLLEFLQVKFNQEWFKKTESLGSISITNGKHSDLIWLNSVENKAILSIRGRELYHFIVRRGPNDQFFIDVDEFGMPWNEIEKISLTQTHLKLFIIFQQARVIDLIFSSFSAYGTSSEATRILARDNNFRGALAKAKKHFDHKYSIFTRG